MAEIENIAESTKIKMAPHKYQWENCEYNSSYKDELLIHKKVKHRDDSRKASRKHLIVTISEDMADIIDLVWKLK